MTGRAAMQGFVQIYTGDGKGKTTAALGLTLRAAGAGLRVYFGQFIKNGDYSELTGLARFADCITVAQFGLGRFVGREPAPADREAAQRGLQAIRRALVSGAYDLVIADEANVAASRALIDEAALLELIDLRPPQVDLVLTGRGAPAAVLARADLVTEMRAVRHYYDRGVAARVGIEK